MSEPEYVYRREPLRCKVVDRVWIDRQPFVRLDPDDARDIYIVPYDEFKRDYQEAEPAVEPPSQTVEPIDVVALAEAAHNATTRSLDIDDWDEIAGRWQTYARRMTQYIIDHLAKPPAVESRVGQWVPMAYIGRGPGRASRGPGRAICTLVSTSGKIQVGLHTTTGHAGSIFLDPYTWDTARARWIADGRPAS